MKLQGAVVAISVAIFAYSYLSAAKQITLNVPRVLLPAVPTSGIKSNFTLKSQQGCFTWTSTKPDVASVEPLYEENGRNKKQGVHCSREAVVTPQSSQPSKLVSIIVAEEQATGQILRCDVFVDTIARIEITTRTRELLLEEEPERFGLQAYDDEGNMFSTIRGHVFEWSFLLDEEATHQQLDPEAILNFVPFEESSYTTDPIIRELENLGLHGDTVLVAGMNTGTAKVQVRLVDRLWKNVSADIVKLLVVENIMLQPSIDVYILPLSFVDYRVERRKHGRTEVVPMPSDQYTLELTNRTVGNLDPQRSRVTGLIVGYTEVVLQDKNMLHTPSASKPSAGVHVVPPHHLGFSIVPGNSWVLEAGREYAITVHVYDKLNHRIIVTENVLLETTIPLEYLHSHFSSGNGSYHHVKALKRGTTSIPSLLKTIRHPVTGKQHDVPSVVSKQQPLEIYDPVTVKPVQLVLLWDPVSEFRYTYTLQASGGSGNYQWSCNPEGVVGVSSSGTLTIITRGKAQVIAADRRNTAHYDQAEVYVVPPAEILFLPSQVEAAIGHNLSLPVQVMGYTDESKKQLLAFPDCHSLKVEITTSDVSIFNITVESNKDPLTLPAGACMSLKARALKSGHTKVTITYTHQDILLEASVVIAAYPPLIATDPENIAVLTLGSSKDFVFEGGPAPWVLDRSKYFDRLSTERASEVAIYQKSAVQVGPFQHVFRVVCKQLGEQMLTVSVGNGPTVKNQFPANETAAARVSCGLPVSMVIHPIVKPMPDCPLLQSMDQNVKFPVRSGRSLELELVVFDAESRPFDNFTSLQWQWSSTDEAVLQTIMTKPLVHRNRGATMMVQLSRQPGSVVVTATSDRHIPQYIRKENIIFKDPFIPGVNFSLLLMLQNEAEITPNSLLVFNHPDNKAILNVNHGSGDFQVDLSTKSQLPVAKVEYSPGSEEVLVFPVAEGQLRIIVNDLCLEADNEISATVHVAGVYSIQVIVADKVQVGNSILAYVRVLDNRGMAFPSIQHRYMHLQPNPKTVHIEVKPASRNVLAKLTEDQALYSSVFIVQGITVGTTHLLFNATTVAGKVVSSWPAEIQIFDALKLSPKYITLLPTATFQIYSSGGPTPQTTIIYSVINQTVATVDDAGLIEAQVPGNTTVTGKAIASDSATGHSVTYSEDIVYVRVLRLTGVRIFVPSVKLLAGVEVAIRADGLNDETPFCFGSALPGLSFHWSATNMDVLSLVSVYDKAGVSLQEEQDFSARLRTRNPGHGTIRLTANCQTGACDPDKAVFTDHVQIQVLPALKLLQPVGGHFLLPHNGHTRIITNRDGISRLSYQLLHGTGIDRQEVVTISPQGEIRTATMNGHGVVLVTAHEEDMGLNQTVNVHIEVQPVASLSIMPLSLAQATPNSKYHAFPLGYSAEFVAHLHDGIGRLFDFAEISLSHRLSRFDIVRVLPASSNATYTVKAAKQGNAILRILVLSTPRISDYVRIRVGYAILPSLATVHLGSKVCFTTHLTEDKPGWWSTEDEGIIRIQPETGVAMALSTGRAIIYHKIQDVIDTHTEIAVAKVHEITFDTSESLPTFTSAQRQQELGTYSIPVKFLQSATREEFSLLQVGPNRGCSQEVNVTEHGTYIQQVPFQCILELKSDGNMVPANRFIQAIAVFEPKSGESFCHLSAIEHGAVETLSTMEKTSLTLVVKAHDYTKTYEVFSKSMNIPFVPAFSVSRNHITLTPADTAAEVTVSGLPEQLRALQVVSPYPVSAVQTSTSVNTALYRISLTEYHSPPQESFLDLKVTFTTNLAYQETVVHVSYLVELPEPASRVCPDPELTVTPDKSAPLQTPIETPIPPAADPLTYLQENMTYYLAIIITLCAVFIGALVICLAVKQSSPKSQGGFSTHLPQSPHQAFSGATSPQSISGFQTPGLQRTPPVLSLSGGQSAFRKPGVSSSPQHGLFSQ